MSASRRPRTDLRGCSVFVFLKCEEVKTSARGLLAAKVISSIAIQQPSSRSSAPIVAIFSTAPLLHTNRRFQATTRSISVAISADFTLFHPISSTAPLQRFQSISADFTRFLHYKDRLQTFEPPLLLQSFADVVRRLQTFWL
ncbi:hypothetical protein LXL04_030068 [Taraxacum kok-saghyz]